MGEGEVGRQGRRVVRREKSIGGMSFSLSLIGLHWNTDEQIEKEPTTRHDRQKRHLNKKESAS